MRKLVVLGVVLAVLGVADLVAKAYVEAGMEKSVRAEIHDVGRVDASISSFPFVGRLLAGGKVSHISLTLEDVVGRGIPVAELRLDVDGLELDRGTLIHQSRLRITGVDSVRITAVLTRDNLETVLGPAAAAVELGGGGPLQIGDGRLRLPGGLSVPMPGIDLLPCEATARLVQGQLLLECESDTLPAIVVQAVGTVDLRSELGL